MSQKGVFFRLFCYHQHITNITCREDIHTYIHHVYPTYVICTCTCTCTSHTDVGLCAEPTCITSTHLAPYPNPRTRVFECSCIVTCANLELTTSTSTGFPCLSLPSNPQLQEPLNQTQNAVGPTKYPTLYNIALPLDAGRVTLCVPVVVHVTSGSRGARDPDRAASS